MISVITPSYNPDQLIFETFLSLEAQSYKNFEWIIIDDNSNNINKKYYEEIKEKASFVVRIFKNEKNLRQAKCKNIGIYNAKYDYIKFLDADDLLDKNHLENQLKQIKIKSGAVFSPTLNFYGHIDNFKINYSYKDIKNDNLEQLKRFIVFPFFSHCGCLFKKQDILKINGFDESLLTDEDGDFIIRLMFNEVLFSLCETSFYYYRHSHNENRVSANDSLEKWDSRERVCIKIEQLINEKSYINLKEQLAQRLDLLGLVSSNYSKKISFHFFKEAKRIYPNYKIPGNKINGYIRNTIGISAFLYLKKIKDYYVK